MSDIELPLPDGMTQEEAQQVFLAPVTDAQELRTYTPGQQDRQVPNTANGELGHCEYCGRSTPFTAAIVMGLPLGMICTCAIEQRTSERTLRQARGASTRGWIVTGRERGRLMNGNWIDEPGPILVNDPGVQSQPARIEDEGVRASIEGYVGHEVPAHEGEEQA